MKLKIKAIAMVLLILAVSFAAGCSAEESPYARNDAEGYSISIKYDANGGVFTTNTSVIVDTYNPAQLPKDGSGNAQIALLAPDNALRGNDAFTAVKNGCFLAGWYAQRSEITDADGNTVYTYSQPWNFETDTLPVDLAQSYTAAEPVLTLYAAWVPLFEVAVYDLHTGEYLDSYTFHPDSGDAVQLPAWNKETGAIEMYRFPGKSGCTFDGLYLDAQGTQPVTGETLTHPGTVDYATGTAENTRLQVYAEYVEGEWFHIYTAQQFADNASVKGSYVIHNDLDFSEVNWPTSFMHGNFSGTIVGNGFRFENIHLTQTNNSKVNTGLFGYITENAQITDVTFENVTLTIQGGTRVAGSCYGLVAGTASSDAVLSGLAVKNSRILIDSACYFGVSDYVIGLVCGMGSIPGADPAEITCEATGDAPGSVHITVSDQTVTVEIVAG